MSFYKNEILSLYLGIMFYFNAEDSDINFKLWFSSNGFYYNGKLIWRIRIFGQSYERFDSCGSNSV